MDLKERKSNLLKTKEELQFAYQRVVGQLFLIEEMEKEEKKDKKDKEKEGETK